MKNDWTIAQALAAGASLDLLKGKAPITACRCVWIGDEPRDIGEREKITRRHLVDLDIMPLPGTDEHAAIPLGLRLGKQATFQEVLRSDVSIYAGGVTWLDAEYDERIRDPEINGWCRLRVSSEEVETLIAVPPVATAATGRLQRASDADVANFLTKYVKAGVKLNEKSFVAAAKRGVPRAARARLRAAYGKSEYKRSRGRPPK